MYTEINSKALSIVAVSLSTMIRESEARLLSGSQEEARGGYCAFSGSFP